MQNAKLKNKNSQNRNLFPKKQEIFSIENSKLFKFINSKFLNYKFRQGYAAISSVIIVAAVVIIVGTSVALASISESQTAFATMKSQKAIYLAEACIEDAMLQSRNNISYTGGTITVPQGTCTVSISKVGNVWTLTVSATLQTFTRNYTVVINRASTGVTLTSWKEI